MPTPAWPITVTRCGRSSLHDAVDQRAQQLGLLLAADQRRRRPGRARARPGDEHPRRLPGRHRLRLALQLERLERLVGDRLRGEPVGGLADGDAARPAGRLQPRGDVDGVAHHRVAVADGAGHHLAGVDPDAQREAHAVLLLDLAR